MGKLNLDQGVADECRNLASRVADRVVEFASARSTVSIERAILRLLGVSAADEFGVPYVNRVVDALDKAGLLADGVALHVGQLAVTNELSIEAVVSGVVEGRLSFAPVDEQVAPRALAFVRDASASSWASIADRLEQRAERRRERSRPTTTLAYVLTATGDIQEDVRHGEAVARHGGDIIALIRSTAQSLLDYVPDGLTREGYGGTFATQANFRIMRDSLDAFCEENGRYVRLSSFSSGLCMPEIAALGALEGLDNMVNDALYGILYRDINMERTLTDQFFSRKVCAAAGQVINTGEDNYLRTADALEAAPSVVASQFINFALAQRSGLRPEQIAIGDAFEIAPEVENGLLLQWAQALLTRELFPDSPVKYMPPTRFMNGNLFRTHACDTLFNLITVATKQGIQTIGVPTEGLHTPHIHDRVLGLECVRYVTTTAKDLHDEIEFREGGIVKTRARSVLSGARDLLGRIASGEDGLFGAISRGEFGAVKRARDAGRGRGGVFMRSSAYVNPFDQLFARPTTRSAS